MEKYLALILLSTPGFIARRVARCLGNNPPKYGEFDSILVYFCYSLGSLFLTFYAVWKFGMFSLNEPWSQLENKMALPLFCVQFFAISMFSSVIVGSLWALRLEAWILNIFNIINIKRIGSKVFMTGSLLDEKFNDDEYHFIVVEKDGKEIASGFLCGRSSAASEKIELFISSNKVYKEWLEKARNDLPDHPLNTVKGTYYDVNNGVAITELDYPPEWVPTKRYFFKDLFSRLCGCNWRSWNRS